MNIKQTLFRTKAYIKYWQKSLNAHRIHSPFVFTLYNEVIASDKEYYAFEEIEMLRSELRKDSRFLTLTDLGAGSAHTKQNHRSVALLAKYSACSPSKGKLLFRLVNFMQPNNIVELGTSLGIGSLYLHLAKKKATFTTFEGDTSVAEIARQNFKKQQATIQIRVGNIDYTLPNFGEETSALDFVFFDANHRYEPTLRYFNICLAKAHENSVFVFDDIYWSEEMQRAWEDITQHPSVQISIDLFDLGIVFFRKNQPKQHFTLRFR